MFLSIFFSSVQATAIKYYYERIGSTASSKKSSSSVPSENVIAKVTSKTSDIVLVEEGQAQSQTKEIIKAVTSNPTKPKIEGLEAMRFFSSLHIVIIHFYLDSTPIPNSKNVKYYAADGADVQWHIFEQWGRAQLTMFFMLSGFVLTYVNTDKIKKLETYAFWTRRMSRLYPMFVLSCVAAILLTPRYEYTAIQAFTVFIGAEDWFAWAYNASINTPAWSIGVFLLLYLVFPTALKIIKGTTDSIRDLILFWFWCYGVTALSALYCHGPPAKDIGGIEGPIYTFILVGHIGEFLMGIALGLLFLKHPMAVWTSSYLGYFLAKIGGTISIILIECVYVKWEGTFEFFWWWGNCGMLAPIFAMMIWCNSFNQDIVISGVFSSRFFVYLGSLSFEIYMFQAACSKFATRILGNQYWTMVVCWVVAVMMRPLEDNVSYYFLFIAEAPSRTDAWKKLKAWWLSIDFYAFSGLVKTLWYYLALSFVVIVYSYVCANRLVGTDSFNANDDVTYGQRAPNNIQSDPNGLFNRLNWMAVLGAPAAVLTLLGHLYGCPWEKESSNTNVDDRFKNVLYFRIVTKGECPMIVRENSAEAMKVLASVLPQTAYAVEVVTDKAIGVQQYLLDKNVENVSRFTELVVPTAYSCPNGVVVLYPEDYSCPTGAKYKARALQYAIENSSARDCDWIVHLDEETRFDASTVRHCVRHCASQDSMVSQNKKLYGDIGQGCILYGSRTATIGSYVCALADSVRVGDHLGRYRLQYIFGQPWAGMHGSFVLCQNAVEKLIGFDHGRKCSLSEFTAFGMMAWNKGIKFSWVDGYMHEQSPFYKAEFIMQRRRWFRSLWHVCRSPSSITYFQRALLLLMTLFWALAPMPLLVTASQFVVSLPLYGQGTTTSNIVLAIISSVSVWNYILGFLTTYNIYEGPVRYFVLLALTLMLLPIFVLMEAAGVFLALFLPFFDKFYTVHKETL